MELPDGWVFGGIPDLRPCRATYCTYPTATLPPLPEDEFRGDFAWLPEASGDIEWAISKSADRPFEPLTLDQLADEAAARGYGLASSFVGFMTRSELHRRVRSFTGCWLDLGETLAHHPAVDGGLVRFLNDQQGAVFWHLVVGSTGDGGVVATDRMLDIDQGGEPDEPGAWAYRCAPSFEAFVYRFWIENELCFTAGSTRRRDRRLIEYAARLDELMHPEEGP